VNLGLSNSSEAEAFSPFIATAYETKKEAQYDGRQNARIASAAADLLFFQ
jgi:hypothetical protein